MAVVLAGCSFSAQLDNDAPPEAGTPAIDAPGTPPMEAATMSACASSDCESLGGSCQPDDSCLIDSGAASVECPAGVACVVVCDSDNACKNSVNCGMATSCHVTCKENNACETGVLCGIAPCVVICDSRGSHSNVCKGMITSAPPAACDVHCCGDGSNLCAGGASLHCTTDNVCP